MSSTPQAVLVHWCTTCGDDVEFEQPVCADDHGADCPEWACVRCGEALLVGFPLPERVPAGRPRRGRSARHVA